MKAGFYRHYKKGNIYCLLGVATYAKYQPGHMTPFTFATHENSANIRIHVWVDSQGKMHQAFSSEPLCIYHGAGKTWARSVSTWGEELSPGLKRYEAIEKEAN